MSYSSNEIKAGAIIVTGLVVLGLFLVAIFGFNYGEETKEYRVNLDYVGGITKGSLVKFNGYNVGQVKEILLPSEENPKLQLVIAVDKDTPVRKNSVAYITSIGIMAEMHVEISAGDPTAPVLPPGSLIPGKEVPTLTRMSESMGELTEQMEALAQSVNDLFNEQNRARIAGILEGVETVVTRGQTPMLKTVEAMAQLTNDMKNISKNLDAITDTTGGKLVNVMENMETTTANAAKLVQELNESMKVFQTTVLANNQNLVEIMENFQSVSQNFEAFSKSIKQQPWLLIRKSAPPDRED
jgi:phospholipid/cholesterol/gamma-HCH transport system substrate-binding protein